MFFLVTFIGMMTIAFDVGGVLTKPHKEAKIKFIAQAVDSSCEEVIQQCTTLQEEKHAVSRGELEEEEYWKLFFNKMDVSYPENWLKKYKAFHLEQITLNAPLLKMIDQLKAQGYKMGIISNQIPSHTENYRKIGLFNHFDVIVISWEVKSVKPEPSIFYTFLEKANTSPEKMLFIDNREENVEAAKALGIKGIHYQYFD